MQGNNKKYPIKVKNYPYCIDFPPKFALEIRN